MAAFTSTQDGNWNDPQTWGNAPGGEYPFKSSAADTASAAHTVTITADNPNAGTGAVTVDSGGELTISNHACAQQFCGAVTVNSGGKLTTDDNANTKKLSVGGSVTINAESELTWKKNSELYFMSTESDVYGLVVEAGGKVAMSGTSSSVKDSKITGHSTYGCYVFINGGTWMENLITIVNATMDYVAIKDYESGGVSFTGVNSVAENECVINYLDVTNPVEACEINVFFENSIINGITNVVAGDTTSAKIGIHCLNCIIGENVSLYGKSSSDDGLFFQFCIFNGENASLNGEATSGAGISLMICSINAGSFCGTATSGMGIIYGYCMFRGGLSVGSAGSGFGIFWVGGAVFGGEHSSIADISSGYGHAFWQVEILGGTLKTTQAKYGMCFHTMISYHKGGRLICSGCECALYPVLNQYFNFVFRKDGSKDVWLYGNTTDISNDTTWNEPVIYRNHETNKTASVYFECSPFNLSDFTTSGVTRNGTNLDVAAGGSIISPIVQPWDVSLWSAITFSTSGGSPTVYTRTSSDGGSSWTSWTSRASGADLSAIATGLNGLDAIQWKLENASGTCTLQNLTITFSYNRETLPEYTEEWQCGARVPTYAKSGLHFTLTRKMPSDSASVTVSLIRDNGTLEPLSSAAASRLSGSVWGWSTANIAAQPQARTHFVAVFADQNANKVFFDLHVGGAEDLAICTDKNVKTLL